MSAAKLTKRYAAFNLKLCHTYRLS